MRLAGDRVILFKEDGALCVHADNGYRPINYMAGPTSVTEEGDVIRVYRPGDGRVLCPLRRRASPHGRGWRGLPHDG